MKEETFESVRSYPDAEAEAVYAQLIGIDDVKSRLHSEAAIMLNPARLSEWSQRNYKKDVHIADTFLRRPPLFIFAGDVGTGKTALAESFADEIARQEDISLKLFKLSLNARGSGIVGEMTKLISQSFEQIREEALMETQKTALILFIDEADALAQSRESGQMHHEDKAGVNALIRGIDSVQGLKTPVLVVMCTNRYDSIDPAVRRRSAITFEFKRPSKEQCANLIHQNLEDIGFTAEHAAELAGRCVPYSGLDYGYTYSDITQRFLPAVLLSAYPDRAITQADIDSALASTPPTAPFNESSK
jgi:SpoVK/Ycf46/Vps4 family AAA+-type ATPase